jgi:hypothetical protein
LTHSILKLRNLHILENQRHWMLSAVDAAVGTMRLLARDGDSVSQDCGAMRGGGNRRAKGRMGTWGEQVSLKGFFSA